MSQYLVVIYGIAQGPFNTKMETVLASHMFFDEEKERFMLEGAGDEWFGPAYTIYDENDFHSKLEGFKLEDAYADWYDSYRDKLTQFTNGNIQFYTVIE